MKKAISAILLALLLVSCGTESGPANDSVTDTDGTTMTETEDTAELLPDLPDKKYGGAEFTIFMRNNDAFIKDQFADELDGEVINDAIFNRNRTVENLFDIKMTLARGKDSNLGNDAQTAILAGDDTYDLVIVHGRTAMGFGFRQLALDWNELAYVDLDKPWWNQDARKELAIGGKLYAMSGDISYQTFGRIVSMVFNKSVLDDLGIDYPYETARNGGWTMDEFIKLSRQCTADLNGDSVINKENDRIGYITDNWFGPTQVLFSAGEHVAVVNGRGGMELTINTPRVVEAFEKFFSFTDSQDGLILLNSSVTESEDLFRRGHAAFTDDVLDNVQLLRDMEDDFGILPWPKYDEKCDRYYCLMGAGSNMINVPITCKDPEMTSAVLEALCYYGWKDVLPKYKESIIEGKISRDEDSLDMLDLIYAGQTFDVGYYYDDNLFNKNISSAGWALAQKSDHNFASFYAENEAKTLELIKAINEAYK